MTGGAAPDTAAPIRAGISRRWIALWLLAAVVTGAAFLAAGAVLVVNQPHRFVIEAQTEALRVPEAVVRIDDAWSVRGAEICEEVLTEDDFAYECLAPSLADLVLVIPNGARLSVQRVDRHLEHLMNDPLDAGTERTDKPAPTPMEVMIVPPAGTEVIRRDRSGVLPTERFSGTVLLRWAAPPLSPLEFRGQAIIGQLPERGNRGVLLAGRASAHMEARAGAPRFEIAGAQLVAGDVVSVVMPDALPWQQRLFCRIHSSPRCLPLDASDMWGFVRFNADMLTGFSVVYAGPADRVVVDRLGANFELKPGWAERLQLDPLAQLLYSGATLAAGLLTILVSLKAGKIIYRDITDRRSEAENAQATQEAVPKPDAPPGPPDGSEFDPPAKGEGARES